jgi:hypothetical protein
MIGSGNCPERKETQTLEEARSCAGVSVEGFVQAHRFSGSSHQGEIVLSVDFLAQAHRQSEQTTACENNTQQTCCLLRRDPDLPLLKPIVSLE